jgi:hypothetical protein
VCGGTSQLVTCVWGHSTAPAPILAAYTHENAGKLQQWFTGYNKMTQLLPVTTTIRFTAAVLTCDLQSSASAEHMSACHHVQLALLQSIFCKQFVNLFEKGL